MTNLLARILLSIMVFPLATLVYIVLLFMLLRPGRPGPRNEELSFLVATIVTAVFVAGYWLWLWRRSVRWTQQRTALTVASGLLSATIGATAGFVLVSVANINDVAFGIFVGGIFAIVLWLPMTVVIWRETAAERAERIRQSAGDVLFCPRCGYNLTGLYAAQCPECGARFTLNELFAAQHREEIADAQTQKS